jgi:hypothetical protein
MARKLRIQYPGAIYHVVNRGDRREAIFADDVDRERLLETLSEACQKIGWPVQAYCLMGNHFPAVLIMASECVGRTFLSAGSGDFPVATGLESPALEFGHLPRGSILRG